MLSFNESCNKLKLFLKKLNKSDFKSLYICLCIIVVSSLVLSVAGLFSLTKNEVQVGALCYSKFYTDEDIANGESIDQFSVHVKDFEAMLKHLKENSIRVITVSELEKFVSGEIELPERCMLITVDNCTRSFYKYAYPLLKEYGMTANVSVSGNRADFASIRETWAEKYCTWNEIEQMAKEGVVEFGSRTYSLHSSLDTENDSIPKEKVAEYKQLFIDDMAPLNEKLEKVCGYKPKFFAFPPSLLSSQFIEILHDDLDYGYLFIGNSEEAYRYFGDDIHLTNYNPFQKGKEPESVCIKRYTPKQNQEISQLIDTIFS